MLAIVGVIANSQLTVLHPYSLILNGVIYYHNDNPIQQGTTIYVTPYSNQTAGNSFGSNDDVDGDGNIDDWTISSPNGFISYNPKTVRTSTIVLSDGQNNSYTYYYDRNPPLAKGDVLYDGSFSGSNPVANIGPLYADPEFDGIYDEFYTDANGIVSWNPWVYFPNSIQLNGQNYYYSGTLVSGGATIAYGQYTNSMLLAMANGVQDIDGDGNVDEWYTDAGAVLHYSMQITYPNSILGYYYAGTLGNGTTILYIGRGSGSSCAPESYGSNIDLDGDGNFDNWGINPSGILSWSMQIMYENSLLGYYYTGSLTSGVTILYTGQGSGAAVAANITESTWFTDSTGTYFEN